MTRNDIPILLTRSRLPLGPLLIVEALTHTVSSLIFATLLYALLSDIFDGVLARRWKIVTPDLRNADSRVDTVYYTCLVVAIFIREPRAFVTLWPWVALLLAMEAAPSVIDLKRYGKACSHHAYTAKAWGLSFFIFAVASLCFNTIQPYYWFCLMLGYINNIEGYVIRALLPLWAHDVSGIPAAIKLRKAQLYEIRQANNALHEVS